MLFVFLFSKYMTLHFDLHVTMEKNKFFIFIIYQNIVECIKTLEKQLVSISKPYF